MVKINGMVLIASNSKFRVLKRDERVLIESNSKFRDLKRDL